MTWGYGQPIKCNVNEIEPNGESLLYQDQYKLNLETDQYELDKVPSPPLGIMLMDVDSWRSWLDSYLNGLLKENFGGFPKACYRGKECEIQRHLLVALHHNYLQTPTEVCYRSPIRSRFEPLKLIMTVDSSAPLP